MSNGQDLAAIPMAQGGLSRLAIARLKSAGVAVAPLLKRAGLTPELIADPEVRLSVRSQITLLDEAAIALKDDCIGFTLARDHDPREIGLLYYVMASSQTLGEALKRIARYSKITNEALVFRYREGNRLIVSPSYSGIPRHSDRHQIEFMFAALRICRVVALPSFLGLLFFAKNFVRAPWLAETAELWLLLSAQFSLGSAMREGFK